MFLRKINPDALGATVSAVCAIHCVVLPLAVATLPVLGVSLLQNAKFEFGMIGLAFVVGISALWHGYRKHHGRLTPGLFFTAGMILLIAKQIWHGQEVILLALALPFILGAHAWNYRLSRIFSGMRNRR